MHSTTAPVKNVTRQRLPEHEQQHFNAANIILNYQNKKTKSLSYTLIDSNLSARAQPWSTLNQLYSNYLIHFR